MPETVAEHRLVVLAPVLGNVPIGLAQQTRCPEEPLPGLAGFFLGPLAPIAADQDEPVDAQSGARDRGFQLRRIRARARRRCSEPFGLARLEAVQVARTSNRRSPCLPGGARARTRRTRDRDRERARGRRGTTRGRLCCRRRAMTPRSHVQEARSRCVHGRDLEVPRHRIDAERLEPELGEALRVPSFTATGVDRDCSGRKTQLVEEVVEEIRPARVEALLERCMESLFDARERLVRLDDALAHLGIFADTVRRCRGATRFIWRRGGYGRSSASASPPSRRTRARRRWAWRNGSTGAFSESVEAVGRTCSSGSRAGCPCARICACSGRWTLRPRGGETRAGRPWLVLRGDRFEGVLWNGPVLELHLRALERLGPDILERPPRIDAMLDRLRRAATQRGGWGRRCRTSRSSPGSGTCGLPSRCGPQSCRRGGASVRSRRTSVSVLSKWPQL